MYKSITLLVLFSTFFIFVSPTTTDHEACSWSPWSAGNCTKPCNKGKLNRTRTCSCPSGCNGESWKLDGDCNTMQCCSWSNWTNYTACDGKGKVYRKRQCECVSDKGVKTDNSDSPMCSGLSLEEANCNVTCQWGNWSDWGQCDAECDGYQNRQRDCLCYYSFGESKKRLVETTKRSYMKDDDDQSVIAKTCVGNYTEKLFCNVSCCNWTEWSSWSLCDTCEDVQFVRTRSCNCRYLSGDNKDQKKDSEDQKKTTTRRRRRFVFGDSNDSKNSTKVDSDQKDGKNSTKDNTDQKDSSDGKNKTKDDDDQKDKKNKTKDDDDQKADDDDGKPVRCTGESIQFMLCNWTWSSWSECPAFCGKSTRRKIYDCNTTSVSTQSPTPTPPSKDYNDNKDNKVDKKVDNKDGKSNPTPTPVPRDVEERDCPCCTYRQWSSWTSCGGYCGGEQYRRQLCLCDGESNCTSTHNDSKCLGIPETQTRQCSNSSSPGCCKWQWDSWSTCTACCGNGTNWRRQSCFCDGKNASDSKCKYSGTPQTEFKPCSVKNCCNLVKNVTNCDLGWVGDQTAYCVKKYSVSRCDCDINNPAPTKCPAPQNKSSVYPLVSKEVCGVFPTNENNNNEYLCAFNDTNNACNLFAFMGTATTNTYTSEYPFSGGNLTCQSSIANCYYDWSSWSECCGTCEESTKWRVKISKNNSLCVPPPDVEIVPCQMDGCCSFGAYGNWSECVVTNGVGVQYRYAPCLCNGTIAPNQKCQGPWKYEEQICTNNNTLYCQWKANATQSACNESCIPGEAFLGSICECLVNGTVQSSSSCDISNCQGKPSQSTIECPLTNCGCNWVEERTSCIGDCSNSTVGTRNVTRLCLCDGVNAPSSNCSGNVTTFEEESCNLYCDNCTWSEWSSWSSCKAKGDNKDGKKCSGSKTRTRQCGCKDLYFGDDDDKKGDNKDNKNSKSKGDNKDGSTKYNCTGDAVETESCSSTDCPASPLTVNDWKENQLLWPNETANHTVTPCSSLTWEELMNKSPLDDWEKLAVQWIAATLNVKSGVHPSSEDAATIIAAELALRKCLPSWGKDEKEQAKSLIKLLEKFNSGKSKYVLTTLSQNNDPYNEPGSSTTAPTEGSNISLAVILVPTLVSVFVIGLGLVLLYVKYGATISGLIMKKDANAATVEKKEDNLSPGKRV